MNARQAKPSRVLGSLPACHLPAGTKAWAKWAKRREETRLTPCRVESVHMERRWHKVTRFTSFAASACKWTSRTLRVISSQRLDLAKTHNTRWPAFSDMTRTVSSYGNSCGLKERFQAELHTPGQATLATWYRSSKSSLDLSTHKLQVRPFASCSCSSLQGPARACRATCVSSRSGNGTRLLHVYPKYKNGINTGHGADA